MENKIKFEIKDRPYRVESIIGSGTFLGTMIYSGVAIKKDINSAIEILQSSTLDDAGREKLWKLREAVKPVIEADSLFPSPSARRIALDVLERSSQTVRLQFKYPVAVSLLCATAAFSAAALFLSKTEGKERQ